MLELADGSIESIMTPRPHVAWTDMNEPQESIGKIQSRPYGQMLVSRD